MGILVRGSPRHALYGRKKPFLLSGNPRNELSASENPLKPTREPPETPRLLPVNLGRIIADSWLEGILCPDRKNAVKDQLIFKRRF